MSYQNLNETELRDAAKKRVKAKKEFRSNVIAYIIVNIGLFVIYALTNWGGYPWFIWPLAGWGIGVVLHYFNVRKTLSSRNGDEIDREVAKMKDEKH